MTLSELAGACGARMSADAPQDAEVRSVSTDTRQLSPGSLFVALKGERFDGRQFLREAAAAGAIAAVVSDPAPDAPLPILTAPDTLAALGAMARAVREKSGARVLGITGSVGKTTTKEMVALALSAKLRVLRSEANQNNEIGVPLTLLKLDPEHQAAVIEMAMRGRGQIEYLSRIAVPDAALITNIGLSHVGILGSQHAIAEAKAEIFAGMREDGCGILNRDDVFFDFLKSRTPRAITYGMHPEADFRALEVEDQGLAGVRFTVQSPEGETAVRLSSGGRHLVLNALAALAAARQSGVPVEEAAAALESFQPLGGRGAAFRMANGPLVIDDAYNASPDSVEAALQALAHTPGLERRTAVLGDMLEMGDHTEEGHRRVGRAAQRWGVQRLVCVGPHSVAMAEEARRAGMSQISWYPSSEEAAQEVWSWMENTDLILVKGSNGTRMSVVVDALRREGGGSEEGNRADLEAAGS